MKILAVGAHPDDIEFAMAGTMIKLKEEGHELVGLVLTKGEVGTRGSKEERESEIRKAADIVGYTLELLDLGDTKIKDDNDTRLIVANIIRKYMPGIVFAPYHTNNFSHKDGAAHFDHTITGNIVRNALRLAKFKKVILDYEPHLVSQLIYYMIPRNKLPTFVNDVSKYVDKMLSAITSHQSQVSEDLIEKLFIFRRYYGLMIGSKLGEPFIVDEPMRFDIKIFE